MKRELICIACPKGCRIKIESDSRQKDGFNVEGNSCPNGYHYAIKEVTAPERTLTTTVKIAGARVTRLPVITDGGIPKEKLFDAMKELNCITVQAPVKRGDTILENVASSGVRVIAARGMCAK